MDTIAAQATPMGRSALAVIRLSGPRANEILQKIWAGENLPEPRILQHGRIAHGGHILDNVMICHFKAPSSYTGEDLLEIYCHGNPVITAEVMRVLLKEGARLAEPGEFTKRAFLNGKLDLVQAEAVAQVIGAQSRKQLESLQTLISGHFSKEITAFRDRLLEIMAWIEAELDFGEREVDDVVPLDPIEVEKELKDLHAKVKGMLAQVKRGHLFQEGVCVVISGRPNVGKSSILNRLCGEERALIDEEAGTTRDYLEVLLSLEGIQVRLIDTAGIHSQAVGLEAKGVDRSRKWLQKADLVLLVLDRSRSLTAQDRQFLSEVKKGNVPTLFVLNKSDLLPGLNEEFERSFLVSAITGQGIPELLNGITTEIARLTQGSPTAEVLCLSLRQEEILEQVALHLAKTIDAMAAGVTGECLTFDLRAAAVGFSRLLGRDIIRDDLTQETEEILGKIFSRFCIGK